MMRIKIFLLAVLASSLVACSFIQERPTDAKLIVQYSTIKVIDGDSDRAARIVEIATEVKRFAGGEEFVTIDLLLSAIRSEIRWDRLEPADTLLVNALIDRLRQELSARFGADILPEDLRLAVDAVAAWVIEAAELAA